MSEFIYESQSDSGFFNPEDESSSPKPTPAPVIDPATQEIWGYLMEVMGDYETFLGNIGSLGFSAPQLLYYRDEVQEFLDELAGRTDINIAGAWKKVAELDNILRAKSQALVDEIGHKNFVQYQIQNDPPRKHWWWWINRVTVAPPPAPKVWEFWKSRPQESLQQQVAEEQAELESIQQSSSKPARDPKIAKLFERSDQKG